MRFRPNVAAVVRRSDGYILICERNDVHGSWQFPQGGIDEGEDTLEGLRRELMEEVGLAPEHYRVIDSRGPYRYDFGGGRMKRGYHGQEQHYYLVELTGDENVLTVETEHPEFRALRWIRPEEFDLSWLLPTKREVYSQVLREFFGIEVTGSDGADPA